MLATSPRVPLGRGHRSIVWAVRVFVEPVLAGGSLLVSSLVTGVPFTGAELLLLLLAFALSFPGDPSLPRQPRQLLVSLLTRWLWISVVLAFLGYATRFLGHFDPRLIAVWLVLTPTLQYTAHRLLPMLLPQLLAVDGVRQAVVVSSGPLGRQIAAHLQADSGLGYRFAGYFCDDVDSGGALDDAPVLGGVDDVAEQVKCRGIETVFIALPMHAQARVAQLLDQLRDTTASVYFVPDIFVFDLIQARIDDLNGMPVVAVCETPFVGAAGLLKRGSDVLLSVAMLALLWPVMLVAAWGVWRSSPGPILFRQRRYGVDGREIVVLKFRTMTVAEDGETVSQARRGDQRVTRWGACLRQTSLDELPQLWNVLQGSMSLVGPRPHAVAHNELYRQRIKGYMLRHKVKPGITGWAQVNGLRGETETVEKMQRRIDFDLEYLRRWSLAFDLLILWRTVRIVLARTNAY